MASLKILNGTGENTMYACTCSFCWTGSLVQPMIATCGDVERSSF